MGDKSIALIVVLTLMVVGFLFFIIKHELKLRGPKEKVTIYYLTLRFASGRSVRVGEYSSDQYDDPYTEAHKEYEFLIARKKSESNNLIEYEYGENSSLDTYDMRLVEHIELYECSYTRLISNK